MRTRPPPQLGDTDIAAAISRAWDRRARKVTYVAVGSGSHHGALEDTVTVLAERFT